MVGWGSAYDDLVVGSEYVRDGGGGSGGVVIVAETVAMARLASGEAFSSVLRRVVDCARARGEAAVQGPRHDDAVATSPGACAVAVPDDGARAGGQLNEATAGRLTDVTSGVDLRGLLGVRRRAGAAGEGLYGERSAGRELPARPRSGVRFWGQPGVGERSGLGSGSLRARPRGWTALVMMRHSKVHRHEDEVEPSMPAASARAWNSAWPNTPGAVGQARRGDHRP